jgi:hypothetical protein
MSHYKLIQTDDDVLNRIQREVSSAFVELEAHPFVAGNLALPVVVATGNVTALSTQHIVVYRGPGGHTVTLPMANAYTAASGQMIFVAHNGGGTLTVRGAGTDTINGLASTSLTANIHAWLVSDGANRWAMLRGA